MARKKKGYLVVDIDDGCPLCGRPLEALGIKASGISIFNKSVTRKKIVMAKVEETEKPS